jgi:hypothetical protein
LPAQELWIARLGPILGGSVIATSAGCFATPAYLVIVSKAVQPDEQATAQSMISLVVSFAYIVRKRGEESTLLYAPSRTNPHTNLRINKSTEP